MATSSAISSWGWTGVTAARLQHPSRVTQRAATRVRHHRSHVLALTARRSPSCASRYPAGGNTAVFVQPIGSPSDAQRITPWRMNCQDRPTFSPDGKLLLFRCMPEGEEGAVQPVLGPPRRHGPSPDHPRTSRQAVPRLQLLARASARDRVDRGRTGGFGADGNADVFGILIRDGKVSRMVNLIQDEKWDSGPGWGVSSATVGSTKVARALPRVEGGRLLREAGGRSPPTLHVAPARSTWPKGGRERPSTSGVVTVTETLAMLDDGLSVTAIDQSATSFNCPGTGRDAIGPQDCSGTSGSGRAPSHRSRLLRPDPPLLSARSFSGAVGSGVRFPRPERSPRRTPLRRSPRLDARGDDVPDA